jgi:hypothetical protein
MRQYICTGAGVPSPTPPVQWPCLLLDESPSSPVSGTIDFQNWSGTITLDDDNSDVSFEITKQIQDEFIVSIPDESATNWPAGQRFLLYYEGECAAGTCEGISNDDSDTPARSSSGGGSGCFLSSMENTWNY